MIIQQDSRILLTGASGMVGSHINNELRTNGFMNIIATSSKDVDLRNQEQVHALVNRTLPEVAILCAARVGGVLANSSYPATFAIDNLLMQTIILDELVKVQTKKIIFVGSSCIYPKLAPLPLTPDSLMTGKLETTNSWYAMAKLSMISALEGVRLQYGIETLTVLPTNLYGAGDNFNLTNGHVIPSLLLRAHNAKKNKDLELEVWGTGNPLREVLYVGDFARAIVKILQLPDLDPIINVGSGEELTISALAKAIATTVGFEGQIIFNQNKPDGVYRKLLDSTYIRSLGWKPTTSLIKGLKSTYDWLLVNSESLRKQSQLGG
jgi:GDP-L-fucose synthase